jgi:hypothetical protein
MESILVSIKKQLGLGEDYTHFDPDIIMHINTALMDLTQQLGIGPSQGFAISDEKAEWSQFIPNASLVKLEGVKTYVWLRVKLLFDPPSSSAHLESYNRQIEKLEWRLTNIAETIDTESTWV